MKKTNTGTINRRGSKTVVTVEVKKMETWTRKKQKTLINRSNSKCR